MSRSAALREALLGEPGVPAGPHSGQAAFCHHLVETRSRDRAQGVWGHTFTSSVVPAGFPLELATQFSWLFGQPRLPRSPVAPQLWAGAAG